MALPVVLTVPLTELAKGSSDHLPTWALASALGYGLAGLPLLLAHRTWFKNRSTEPRHWAETAMLGAIAGATKGVGTSVIAMQLGVTSSSLAEAVSRVPTAASVGAAELLIGAVLLSAVERLERSRFALLDERVRFSQLQLQEEQLGAAMRQVVFRTAEQDLYTAFSDLRRQLRESDQASIERQWNLLSDAITDAAHNRLRQLSHTLWATATSNEPTPLSLRDLLQLSVRRVPLSPGLVSTVYIGSQLTLVSAWQSWQTTAVVSALDILLIFSTAQILRRITASSPHHALSVVLGTLGVLAAGFALQPAMLGLLPWGTVMTTLVPLNVLWFTFLSVSSSLWRTLLSHPDALLDDLEHEVSDSKVRAIAAQRETKRLAGELAKFVHGTLQSRLMVASLQTGPNAPIDERVLHDLRQTIEAPLQGFMQSGDEPLSEALHHTQEEWAGLVTITVDIDLADAEFSPTDQRFLTAVVDEAVANASRHGWADRVNVRLERDSSGLLLTVTDNGIGPRIGEPGLGTKLYSSDSRATWSLTQNERGGATLQLGLAVQ